jgi:hypothetical protein
MFSAVRRLWNKTTQEVMFYLTFLGGDCRLRLDYPIVKLLDLHPKVVGIGVQRQSLRRSRHGSP